MWQVPTIQRTQDNLQSSNAFKSPLINESNPSLLFIKVLDSFITLQLKWTQQGLNSDLIVMIQSSSPTNYRTHDLTNSDFILVIYTTSL